MKYVKRNALAGRDGEDVTVVRSALARWVMEIAGTRVHGTTGKKPLDAFTSDVGVETRGGTWREGRAVTFSPFVGLGAGARSYNYRKLDVDATHNLASYGAIGGEIGVRRVGVRVEVRDYVSGFRPLVGTGSSATRNDVVVMMGLRFKRRSAN